MLVNGELILKEKLSFSKNYLTVRKTIDIFSRVFVLTAKGKANFKSHFSCFIVVVTVRPRTAL